jgi:hypothetical protein
MGWWLLSGIVVVWLACGVLTGRILQNVSKDSITDEQRLFMSLFSIVCWPAIWALTLTFSFFIVIVGVLKGK